jgi:hypothetical protein
VKLYAGIPVLYIPGNSGSYKQVRSFGAEAYRGFFGSAFYPSNGLDELLGRDGPEDGKNKNSLDFWTVDFNEELSGLSGHLLENQIDYVLDCIKFLNILYAKKFKPRFETGREASIILVGHSMGGIVALSAVLNDRYIPNTVNVKKRLSFVFIFFFFFFFSL